MDNETEKSFEIISKYTLNSRDLINFGIIIGLLIIGFIFASHQISVIGTRFHGDVTYFFWNESSGINGYTIMNTTVPPTNESNVTTFSSVSDGQLLVGRINTNTNLSTIQSSIWAQHTELLWVSGTKDVQLNSTLYKRLLDGTEIKLSDSGISNILPHDGISHDIIWTGEFPTRVFLNNTDMIVMKLHAVISGSGSAPTFNINIKGTSGASIIFNP